MKLSKFTKFDNENDEFFLEHIFKYTKELCKLLNEK